MLKVVPGKSVSLEELQASSSVNDDKIVVSELENVVSEQKDMISEQEDEDKENNQPEFFETSRIPKLGDFVIVKFVTKKSIRHFVSQIIEVCRPDVHIKLLRMKRDIFVFPQQDDISIQTEEDIIQYLHLDHQPRKKTLIQAVKEQDIQEAEAEQIVQETSSILKKNMFDVGCFLSRINSIDNFTRYQLITNHWVPDKYYSFPYSIHGKRGREEKRRVNHGHLETLNWLVFSNEKQGLFCKYCAVFLPDQLVGGQKNVIPKKFVTEPLTKYAKLSGKDGDLNHHQLTNYHREAVKKGEQFLVIYQKPELDIRNQLSDERKKQVLENRARLIPILKTIILHGQQNIPLRGHRDDGPLIKDSGEFNLVAGDNDGCFRALLRFLIDAGDTVLKEHLKKFCGECHVYKKGAKNFVGFLDLHKSNYDSETNEKVEPVITGEILGQTVIKKLKSLGLNLEKRVGIGCDGCSVNLSQAKGAAVTIQKEAKNANASSKRNFVLEKYLKHKLSSPCETRWIERYDSIIDFQKDMSSIEKALREISEWNDITSSSKSNILLKAMCDIEKQLIIELEVRLEKGETLLQECCDIQQIIDGLYDDLTDQAKERQSFEDIFYHVMAIGKKIIKDYNESIQKVERFDQSVTTILPPTESMQLSKSVKLPQIQLPTFSGDYDNWMEFRDMFDSLIHSNELIESWIPLPLKHFMVKKVAASEYKTREIPCGSSDSELSDDQVTEPTTVQLQTADYFMSASDDSEEDPEDNIPLSKFVTTQSNTKKQKKESLKWKKTTTTQKQNVAFLGSEILPNDILQLNSPYELFSHFFSQEFITEIVLQTCIYSVQLQEETMPLLSFKTILAQQLCKTGVSLENRKVGRPRSSTTETPPKRRCLEPRPNHHIQSDQSMTEQDTWRHVSGNENPADLASRGVSAQQLLDSDIWWHDAQAQSLLTNQPAEFPFNRFSKFTHLIRTVAYCLRFSNNCKFHHPKLTGASTVGELNNAETCLLKISQRESFPNEITNLTHNKQISNKSRIISLNPFCDTEGILRVGGRLGNSQYSYDKIHPKIVSSNDQFTKLMFSFEHIRLCHAGPQLLLSSIKEKYWPVAENLRLRTDFDFRSKLQEHHLGTSIIESISNLDIINSFSHLLYLGVVKKLIVGLWCNGTPATKLSFKEISDISDTLVNQRKNLSSEFNRKPRPLSESKRWKATEFRQFLLYTGPIVLKSVLSPDLLRDSQNQSCSMVDEEWTDEENEGYDENERVDSTSLMNTLPEKLPENDKDVHAEGKFSNLWLKVPEYEGWLIKSKNIRNGNEFASFKTCNVDIYAHRNVIRRHVQSARHAKQFQVVASNKTILNMQFMGSDSAMIHLSSAKACLLLARSVEDLLRNLGSHFSRSFSRIEAFKEFQIFFKVDINKILRPSNTRWLSLQACCDRVLEQYEPLKAYLTEYKLFNFIEIVDPCKAQSFHIKSLSKVFERFPFLKERVDPQAVDNEWRNHATLDHEELGLNNKDNATDYWHNVFKLKNAAGIELFANLKIVIHVFLVLPFSNASVERIFSKMNDTKTDLRNCLNTDTLSALLHAKQGVKDAGGLLVFEPSKKMLDTNIWRKENQF
ncbi:hypothetical protein NQ314_006431 [Rhamnusium bicolor]|uniref:HAT C-terminal dimerisation domain-containing protein n=1 Tax=Rhamnusium bicolor TaxID=1586634 RepID=A0AAV8Z588_9CUCU|nr:hypothetical protein NQ314_006431 [Rhamnusium bicolor]